MTSNDNWTFDTALDAIKCVVTVPPTQVDYTCTARVYENPSMASVPLKTKKNYYILLDPKQDGSVREGIYREYGSISAQLPNNTINGTRYKVRGWTTLEEARRHWADLCREHHKCDVWALEAARRDADLARPRLLMVELSGLYPGIMSSVPVTLSGQMQFSDLRSIPSSSEVSASPNLIRSPPSTPSRSARATSLAPMSPQRDAPPPSYESSNVVNGDWALYVVTEDGVYPYDNLRRAYRGLRRHLRSGPAALLLALSEDAADQWFNPTG